MTAREQCETLCECADRDFTVLMADDPDVPATASIRENIDAWGGILFPYDKTFFLFTNSCYYDRAITWALECLQRVIVARDNSDFVQMDDAPVFASPGWSMAPATVEFYHDPALPGNDR